ncbi:MAG: undecaprenyl diphosphate synthase family protein [Candidatus Alkanophagales archaeon]
MGVLLYLYERWLLRSIRRAGVAVRSIILIIDESDLLTSRSKEAMRKLASFVRWCSEIGVSTVGIYVSIAKGLRKEIVEATSELLLERISRVLGRENATVEIYTPRTVKLLGRDGGAGAGAPMKVCVSIGFGGRCELTEAIKRICARVVRGELEPEEIDEKVIEDELVFKFEPDLIIRSGGAKLTDFLIWQSVYSEFYFTDVNWQDFRKIDLLRAIRDFQKRERRFGT